MLGVLLRETYPARESFGLGFYHSVLLTSATQVAIAIEAQNQNPSKVPFLYAKGRQQETVCLAASMARGRLSLENTN